VKYYQPLHIQPNKHQLQTFMGQHQLSDTVLQSPSYHALCGLFAIADGLWRTLDFHTSQSLGVFVDAKQYLTPTQEHDLVSLTASYVQGLGAASDLQNVIEADSSITEEERAVFLQALKLFQDTAATTNSALGRPCWIEP
jgi:hypothetical protein